MKFQTLACTVLKNGCTTPNQYAPSTSSKLGAGHKNTGQLFFHEESIYEVSKP